MPFVPISNPFRALLPLLVGLIAFVAYALTAIPAIHTGLRGISPLFQDDAFYYLVTARNFVANGLFAFDNVNETNGFHPLWMAIVVALFKACGNACTPEQQIFAVKLTETLLRGVGVALCVGFYAADAHRGRGVGIGYLGVAALLLCPAFVIFEQGMETTLAAALLILVIHALVTDAAFALGVLLALLFLARLDTAVFIAGPILAAHCVIDRAAPRRLIVTAAPLVLTFAAYAGYNLWHTDHAVPISGAIRSSFPAITSHGSYLVELLNIASMFGVAMLFSANILLAGAGLVLGLPLVALVRADRVLRRKLLLIALVGASLLANLLLFQKWEKSIDPRYLALPLVASVFFLFAGLGLASDRAAARWGAGRLAPLALAAILLAQEALTFAERFPGEYAKTSDPVMEFFHSVRDTLPPSAVIAGTDVGALAFWTGRRVVNLDGVINNYAYQDYLRDGRLQAYLREQGVDHLATPLVDRAPTYTGRPVEPMYRQAVDAAATEGRAYAQHDFYVYSYVYHVYSDRIALKPSQEVFRRAIGNSADSKLSYVVYRLQS